MDRPDGEPGLWEQHASWWQDGFTEGADPEYVEQILPLAASHLDGAARVLDVGCGEGQVARLAKTRSERDEAAAKAALDALREGAKGDSNLLALSVEAARARATLGRSARPWRTLSAATGPLRNR